MALILEKETEFGVNVEYWRITSSDFNWIGNICHIKMAGYKDKQARLDGYDCLMFVELEVNSMLQNELDNINIQTFLYNKVKELPDWEDAADDV